MPADLPAISAGLFGYLGYDMIRLVEHLPNVNPDPIGAAGRGDAAALGGRGAGRGEGRGHGGVAGLGGLGADGAGRLCPGGRAGDGCGARPRTRGGGRDPQSGRGRSAGRAGVELHQGRLQGRRRNRQGLHPGGRHLPGRAVAALGTALSAAALRALPLPPAHQPVALHVLLQFRQLPDRRRQPRDPRAAARRRGDHPPDRRHPSARANARGGSRAGGRSAGRPEGAAPNT